jgi:uncharacterized protein
MGINASDLKAVIGRYHHHLTSYRDALNALNVYPVPDGDTGTNMALTMGSVVQAVDSASSMSEVTTRMAHGSLMGARGNSGVILSQILRGLATRFEATDVIGPAEMADGLSEATSAAYRAVSRPVEGTILSVLREAAEEAVAAVEAVDDIATHLDRIYGRALSALRRTPDQLPILKQAGVVDAGGAGLVLLFGSFLGQRSSGGTPGGSDGCPSPSRRGAPTGRRAPVRGHVLSRYRRRRDRPSSVGLG